MLPYLTPLGCLIECGEVLDLTEQIVRNCVSKGEYVQADQLQLFVLEMTHI